MATETSNEYQGEEIRQEEYPPKAPPRANYPQSDYIDGDTSPLQGINPGRDQDRSRVDERIAAKYNYNSKSYEAENETGVMEGF